MIAFFLRRAPSEPEAAIHPVAAGQEQAPAPPVREDIAARAPALDLTPKLNLVRVGDSGGCGGTVPPGPLALLRAQKTDGSWGDGTEEFEGRSWSRTSATSLSLLALLGGGWTHLTKECWDEGRIRPGEGIKAGLKWLLEQRPADATEAALAALTLCEWRALTGSQLSAQPASDALARLDAFQHGDGTWGDSFQDWLGSLALVSARSADFDHLSVSSDRARLALRDRLETSPDLPSIASAILFNRDKTPPGLDAVREDLLIRLPDPANLEFTRFWMGSIVMYQLDGPDGEGWKTWNNPVKTALISTQAKDGTWGLELGSTASVVRDALGVLTLEIYYRYECVAGGARLK